MTALKQLALSRLVETMSARCSENRRDVDRLTKLADYLHKNLPVRLLEDFSDSLSQSDDLNNNHFALMVYPSITSLNLRYVMKNCPWFDLEFILQCSEKNMQQLKEMRFPVGSTIKASHFKTFCQAVPSLSTLVLYDCEIDQESFSDLATLCSKLTHLNLRYTRVVGDALRHLCGSESHLRSCLKSLDLRGTSLGECDVKNCLQTFPNLEELQSDHCLFDCLFQMHAHDVRRRKEIPKYNLTEISSTCNKGVNVESLNLASVACPNVRTICLNVVCFSWMLKETFQALANFELLRDLSISFKLPSGYVFFEILGPALEKLSPRLEKLCLMRVADTVDEDASLHRWNFDFRRLQKLLLYGVQEHPLSVSTLASVLKTCVQMRLLMCSFVVASDELVDVLANSQLKLTLNNLFLYDCPISIASLQTLLTFPNLKKLTLRNCISAVDNDFVESIKFSDDMLLTIA